MAASVPAFAGRPFTTEDASVLAAKACQMEAWIDRGRDGTDAWLVPACNFGAGIEWQAGFARSREDGESRFSEAYVQAKGLFRGMRDDSPWGVGWVVGTVRRPLQSTHRGWDNPYALIPVSLAVGDSVLVHANAGWSRDREARRAVTPWGIAVEVAQGERLAWIAEAFGENSEKPFLRGGARYAAIPGRLDVDLTWVTRPGGTRDERFVSLGVTLQSDPFLP